jgi:hypothetical protein
MWRPLLSEINEYRREVFHHWIELAAGSLMVVLGFVASGTGFVIPPWVWWALALVFLAIAQFRAYRDILRRLKGVEAIQAEAAVRRDRLMHQRELTGESCFIWEVFELVEGTKPVTNNRIFRDCHFDGPAIVAFMGKGRLDNSNWGVSDDPDTEFLYRMEAEGTKQGLFGFVNCEFERCHFKRVGIYADDAFITEFRTKLLRL